VPGTYAVGCWVRRERDEEEEAVQGLRLFDFVVEGRQAGEGVVSVRTDVEAIPEPRDRP
jgi:hypothetical protein